MDRLTIQDGNIGFVDNSQLPSYAALYEKLRKYEDLEEQGRLLKLPRSLGDILDSNPSTSRREDKMAEMEEKK